jgi:hypothetical protein
VRKSSGIGIFEEIDFRREVITGRDLRGVEGFKISLCSLDVDLDWGFSDPTDLAIGKPNAMAIFFATEPIGFEANTFIVNAQTFGVLQR